MGLKVHTIQWYLHSKKSRKCLKCGAVFETPTSEIKRGRGKYCSRSCYYQAQKGVKRPWMSSLLSQLHKLGRYASLKGRIPWNKGKTGIFSEEALRSMSRKRKGRSPTNKGIYGVHHSPKTEFTTARLKQLWQDPKFRNKIRLGWLKSVYEKPNKTERRFIELIQSFELPFKHNDKLVIDGLTPDFIATDGTKRFIELFGEPFHSSDSKLLNVDYKRCYWGRKAIFKSHGYDTFIFWYKDFWQDPLNIIERVKSWKLNNFKEVGNNPKIHATAKIVNPQNLELGADVTIGDFVFLNAGIKTSIGNGSQINSHSVLVGGGELIIEEYVTVSYHSTILTGSDTPNGEFMVDAIPENLRCIKRGKTIIKNKAFIGEGSLIMPAVEIAEGVVVRAKSYVDKDLTEPYTIYQNNKPLLRRVRK